MRKLSSLVASFLLLSAPLCAAQTATAKPQIDCNWLTVDTTAKTATFQLTSGLTPLNGGLNFNGFNDGKLTLTVPTGWTVVIRFTNHDANLPHSAEVVDTTKPIRREQDGVLHDLLRGARPWPGGDVDSLQGVGDREAADAARLLVQSQGRREPGRPARLGRLLERVRQPQ